ncbi:unnamed protein product, partial [Medioppia subpectinata]
MAPINDNTFSIFSSLSESANGILFGTICGLFLVLVLLSSVLCFLKRKASETSGSDDERLGLTALIRRTNATKIAISYFKRNLKPFPKNFPIAPLMQAIRLKTCPKIDIQTLKATIKLGYDQTRVILNTIEGIPGSDYINADFVEGYKRRKVFICAQGPTQKTVNDFWRMIYEQKCRVIVMLTGIEEQGRIKCSQYWSEEQPKEISNMF